MLGIYFKSLPAEDSFARNEPDRAIRFALIA